MNYRRKRGDETRSRLLNWSEATKASERLSAQILLLEGFQAVDPSHPLGGPDGLKDVVCIKGGLRWVAAAYFPRGQKSWGDLRVKFETDVQGVVDNSADGFAFVTNQEVKLADRERLLDLSPTENVEIYHLERVATLLDQPRSYGVRLEFLDIEMSKEEQLAFFASMNELNSRLTAQLTGLIEEVRASTTVQEIPLEELYQFKSTLQSIVGSGFVQTGLFAPPIQKLNVPITELREFEATLKRLTGGPFPKINFLENEAPLDRLSRLPLELQSIEQSIDRIIWKLNQANNLKNNLQ